MNEVDKIINGVKQVFSRYRFRDDIEKALEDMGFKLWANTIIENGRYNSDEQIWAYDREIPNGQVLVLVNWIEGFYWVYRKEDRGNLE